MHVPETAVNEDDRLSTGKYEVRLTRKILAVEPEPVAAAVHKPTDEELGFGVRAPYCAHVGTSAGLRDLVQSLSASRDLEHLAC